jgi:hypothetical protein
VQWRLVDAQIRNILLRDICISPQVERTIYIRVDDGCKWLGYEAAKEGSTVIGLENPVEWKLVHVKTPTDDDVFRCDLFPSHLVAMARDTLLGLTIG